MRRSPSSLREWLEVPFALPVFKDEDERRVALILRVIILSLMGTCLVVALISLTSNTLFAMIVGLLILLTAYGHLRRKQLTRASLIILVGMLSVLVYLQMVGQGTHDIAVIAYPLVVVMASLLMGRRGYVGITLLAIMAVSLVALAEMLGLIPSPFGLQVTIVDSIIAATLLIVVAVAVHLLSENLRRSLDRARHNEQAQVEANRELQAIRASLEDRITQRTAQLSVSAEVSRAITSVLDPDELIPRVVQLITDRFGFYYAAIFLIDEIGEFAMLREATGEAGRLLKEQGHRLEVGGQSMVGTAIAQRKPRVARNVGEETVRFANPMLPFTQSEVALPLAVGDQVLGALDVQSAQLNAFDENALAVLQSLADQIAIALNNARQFRHAQLDARQATALFEASRVAGFISENLTTAADHLLNTVAGQAEFDTWLAVLYDSGSASTRLLTVHDSPASASRAGGGRAVSVEQALDEPISLAIRMRQRVVINDPEIEPLLSHLPLEERRRYGRSVSVPAMLGNRVVGAIGIGRALDKSPIGTRDVQLAEAVANQLAVTIENRSLFEQAQQAVADLDALMRRYTREGWEKFTQTRRETLASEYSLPDAAPLAGATLSEIEQAARAGSPAPIRFDGQSAVAVPITLRGELIGVLGAQDGRDRPWTEDELMTLRAVADQIAQSAEAARLLDETETSLKETTALYEASRAMTTAATPGEVMQIAVNAIYRRLQIDQVRLVLFDEEQGYGRIEAEAVRTPGIESVRLPMAGNPSYEVLAQRHRPVAVYDVANDPLMAAVAPTLMSYGIQSVLLLPLVVGQRLIGSIGADSMQTRRHFAESEIAFCETVARQAAVALENRRLLEETQRRAQIEMSLNQISQTIRASLDPQAVLDLEATIGEMGRVLRASRSFYLTGGRDNRFIYAYEWCAPNASSFKGGDGSWIDLPDVLRRLRSGEPLIVECVDLDTDADLQLLMRARGVQAHLHVPVVTGNRLVGVLGFEQIERDRRWLPEEINMVQRVSDQLAAALENARLYQDVRARVNELTALTRIGRRLAATLELREVLNTIVEEALNVTPADRGSIALYDMVQDALDVQVLIGYPDLTLAHMREHGHNLLHRGDGLHGRLLATGQAVLSNDVTADPDYLAVDDDTRSELIVPIRKGDTLLGALNLESPRAFAFSEADRRLIEALADQAAVAIANARSYESERHALERMREVDRLKTQFLANMSHELRTPLNSIIGFSRVILRGIDGPLTELQQADLTAIHNSGQHLLGLINDILDLSKIEAGKMELSLEDLDLRDIIKGVMSTAIALVKDKTIDLHQEVPAELPAIKADSRRIRQVVLNLVSNAAKFTEKGHITARVIPDPREVLVIVADTGIGIPPDKLDHIFEEFTQVDASTTRRAGGTGLGLAISRRFIEMHGGRMWVESEVGVGSKFCFTLPTLAAMEAARQEEAPPEPEETAIAEDNQRRILCIDDDPNVITLYRRYLQKQGYQVVALHDATRAVEEARRVQPMAITLDVLMPNRDGWSALADLKSTSDTKDIPIIVCSIIEDQSKGFSLGAAEYLVKPIAEGDLLRALDRVRRARPIHTVLIVDDEVDAIRLLRRLLESQSSYRVLDAQGGAQGIAAIHVHAPDVVILDLMMPDIDGFAVLETIKSNRHTQDIPVVIVTAKDLTEDDRARLRGKAAALLNKGMFGAEDLLAQIAAALDQITEAESVAA